MLLLFGARGHQKPKPGGHLALLQGGRAPLRDVWGTEGRFIKGLGASGLESPEPIYLSINQSITLFLRLVTCVRQCCEFSVTTLDVKMAPNNAEVFTMKMLHKI
jgi:hypothetical protein